MTAPRFVQPSGGRAGERRDTAALVCGIAGVALCVLTLGLASPLTLVLGGVALGLGLDGRRRGGSHTQASIILGAVALGLSAMALVLWALLVLLGGLAIEMWGIHEGLDDFLPQGPLGPSGDPA